MAVLRAGGLRVVVLRVAVLRVGVRREGVLRAGVLRVQWGEARVSLARKRRVQAYWALPRRAQAYPA